MAKSKPDNSWNEWGNHVLTELERQGKNQDKIFDCLTIIKQDIAGLKVKSGIWGVIGGLIPVVILIILHFLLK